MIETKARIHDLIAKTSRVTIKDTCRVMRELALVAEHLDCDASELLGIPADGERPTADQADACNREFKMMCKKLNEAGRGGEIKELRAFD